MSDGFQFYEGTATESAEIPRITVRRGGVLILTQAAVQMLGDGVERVQVGFNAKTRAIGLRGLAPDGKGGYLLRQQANGVSRLIDGKRVFAHHGLKVDKAQSYEAEDFGNGVIGVTLAAPAASKPTRPAKASASKQ